MISFSCEEQDGKKRLVYQKQAEDKLDTMTLEMIRNNRIEGLVPFDSIQIDKNLYMTYDITGLITMKEYLCGVVNRAKLFQVLDAVSSVLIAAEEYMLETASFVLDEQYIFIHPQTNKISMIALPIIRTEQKEDLFLKRLFMSIQYDQTEDCSYVAELINLFSEEGAFSVHKFRNRLLTLRDKKTEERKETETKAVLPEWAVLPDGVIFSKPEQKVYDKPENFNPNPVSDLQPEQLTEEKKEKRGFFKKKQKEEKKEKQGKEKKRLFGKKSEKKETAENVMPQDIPFPGIAIPPQKADGKTGAFTENQIPDMIVPAQNVGLEKQRVAQQDFGETVYANRDSEATVYMEEKRQAPGKRFVLCRCSTKKTYEILGDVVRVGRNPAMTEICIDGNPVVGRIHAVLYKNADQIYIADNNSKNKTYVNDTQIQPGANPRLLVNGDRIRLGDEEMEFYIVE